MRAERDQVPLGPRRTALWVLGLLVAAISTSGILAAVIILLLPRGRLFGLTAFHVCPFNFIVVWAIGTLLAYHKYRSARFAGMLAVVGAILLPVLLFCSFIGIFIMFGPLNLK